MLRAIALACAFLAAAAAARACEMFEYKRLQASRHVHVFQAAEGTTGVVNGNIVVVVGRDGILVVDTGQIPSVARRVVEDIRKLSPLPVRYIVNTHWHGDHMLANFVFKEAWPEAKILAHSHTIAEGARFYTDYAAKFGPRLPGIVADMRKAAAASKSEEAKLFTTRTADCAEKMAPEVTGTRYVAPDVAMDDEMKVDLGGLTVLVKHMGSGNTPGDLIAWIEADGVLATGDMVVAPAPYAIGSTLPPWIETLGKLRALGAKAIVPGHGPLMRDDAYLRDLQALLETTHRQLQALKASGVAKEEAPARLEVGPFRERYLDTAMRRQAFEQFFVRAAVAMVWK